MFRNREVKIGFFLLAGAGILCGSGIFGVSREGFYWFLAFFAAALTVYLSVSRFRYRRIQRLSLYLKRVLNGEKGLNAPDNEEGELSLLRNDIYKLIIRLETQAELLEKDKTYLADSLSDISHQLKTPMTSMMVMTDLLKDGELPPKVRDEFTDTIRSQLRRMEWLLNSLLKMSRLDAGTVQFRTERIPVTELVDKAVEHLLIPIELKGQELKLQVAADQYVDCDLSWTAEALANVVKNCMEHTPEGGRIRIRGEDRGLYFQLTVEDNGEGIAAGDLPHIFERFYKGKNSGKDSVGIGLAMAKHILNKQGGRIEAVSREGEGTCFFLRLYRRVI